MKNLIFISLLSLGFGCLFFCLYHNWILISIPSTWQKPLLQQAAVRTKKKVILSYWQSDSYKTDSRELVWPSNILDQSTILIKSWLTLLDEEHITPQKVSLQLVTVDLNKNELIVSLDRAPFAEDAPTYDKLMCIESLLKTLRDKSTNIQIPAIRFLVHHQPIHDDHLDFSRPWPLAGFSTASAHQQSPRQKSALKPQQTSITLMINPSGDARYTGRTIHDTFERSITFACAQELKKALEARVRTIQVVITRSPGQTLEPLQAVAFANRLNVDLYITLSCYQEPPTSSGTHIFFYYFLYHPITDFWHKKQATLNFYPYNQAHVHTLSAAAWTSWYLYTALRQRHHEARALIQQPIGIPFKPLIGATVPSLGCEIGLVNSDDWHTLIEPLTQALIGYTQAITSLN